MSEIILPEITLEFEAGLVYDVPNVGSFRPGVVQSYTECMLVAGEKYTVIFDGNKYVCEAVTFYPEGTTENCVGFGRTPYSISASEPFGLLSFSGMMIIQVADFRSEYDYNETRTATISISKYVEGEETEPLSFIKFLCSNNFPFLPKNLFGWKLAQRSDAGGGSSETANVLTSSDGYALLDSNGLYLIPKEAN